MNTPTQTPKKNKSLLLIALGIFALACIIFALASPESEEKTETTEPTETKAPVNNLAVYNDELDGSVIQVEEFLRKNLNDADSYDGVEWGKVMTADVPAYKYFVWHKYRAKNKLGATVLEKKMFYLDAAGKVVDYRDVK